ncbi:hypothetical protein [Nostoc sp.]|uniref:hypothetical protein n=1 Tax=Nostoc sp. TaxID=1180 RepID=UPI002FFBC336
MSNIDNITSTSNYSVVGHEQLFTELTPEEGAMIKGGANYSLVNRSGNVVKYTLNGKNKVLNPNQDVTYSGSQRPDFGYYKKIGSNYKLVVVKLTEGQNSFYGNGYDLKLIADIITT